MQAICSPADHFFGFAMIKCNLSSLMGEKKLKISDVVRDTGLDRGTITRLYHEKAVRVEFEVLNQLCKYLQCDIDELLQYVKETAEE